MSVGYVLFAIAAAAFAIWSGWRVWRTRAEEKRGDWGIHFTRIDCPKCGAAQPGFRKPGNARQALWGGYTCANCGAEMDKWGKLRRG